ncbi:TIGR02391 family protein [Corynebacterium sp. Marseille-P8863]|uniref:TIGR02391 family protein n=1 Tax=Corynebacterium sp. Marseille-P8863 TaxID=2866576 RepID=UPI0022652CC5|nr:TIGR02391 family protein [Corynebacterium sp. Marseille-P8863]
MNSLNFGQKDYLKTALGLRTGYVLNLSREDVSDLFSSIGVDILKDTRVIGSGDSMGRRMSRFLMVAEDQEIVAVLKELRGLQDSAFAISEVTATDFRERTGQMIAEIEGQGVPLGNDGVMSESGDRQPAELLYLVKQLVNEEILSHTEQLLLSGRWHEAIEEAFKLVREQLRLITGEERASDVFKDNGRSDKFYLELFGTDTPASELDERERDYFVGIAQTHLAIQNFRNVFTHTPARKIDSVSTLQYLSLASFAYEAISQFFPQVVSQEIRDWVTEKRKSYPSAKMFYREFYNHRWAVEFPPELRSKMERQKRRILESFIDNADFTVSYDESNIWLMCLQLFGDEIDKQDLDRISKKQTEDQYGNDQMAGWEDFCRSIS